MVQRPSGKGAPISQRRSSQSVLSAQGPPTKELSFPAVPLGRESPQPSPNVIVISTNERTGTHLMTGLR
jgi:hypothetical protein